MGWRRMLEVRDGDVRIDWWRFAAAWVAGTILAGTAWVLLPPMWALVAIAIAATAGITFDLWMARRHVDSDKSQAE
jgi:Flp pilus assembly protein TadB